MWRRFKSVRLFLFSLAPLCSPLVAAASPAQTHPALPPKPPTLASVLPSLASLDGVLLAVGADKIDLPKEAPPPPASPTLDDIALAFNYQKRAFGIVTALAPAMTVVLNTDPNAPNIAADINPSTAIKLLVATLDDAQWHALTSDTGLGLSDLTDEMQRGLFHALFRGGQLFVASDDPNLRKLPEDKRTDIQDMTDKIDGVHLRMGQTSNIYVHDKAGRTIFFGDKDADKTPGLTTYHPKQDPPAMTHGVVLRTTVPNNPKPGELNLNSPFLQISIPLIGLHTVEELTTRIGMATHTELYADPHYAARTVTILGRASNAPAADLLRALCVCVCGTLRRVGPAFVLTDDLVGVGVRRQILSEWDKKARALNSDMTDAAGRAILARHGSEIRQVPSFNDPMALTPEQIKAEKLSDGIPQVPGFDENTVSYSQLTPVQQNIAKSIAADYNDKRASGNLPEYLADDRHQAVDPNPTVSLNPQMRLQFIVPTLSEPVDTTYSHEDMMFFVWPGDDIMYANYAAAAKKKPVTPPKPAPPLGPLLHTGAHRALLAHPRTVADVDALIPVMQKLGFNELYLDVFSDGIARIAGTSLSPAKTFDGPDILTEAITRGKAAGIAVYADMNLLTWGDKPPASLADPNILGEDTTEVAVRRHALNPETERDDDGNPIPFTLPAVDVNPAAARSTLVDLISAIAAVPGLAGFVWQGTVPDSDVGYTPAMRLGFLRARHADPLDIDGVASYDLPDHVDLPQFDDDTVDSALPDQWDTFRKAATLATLRTLRRAATLSHPSLPVLVESSEFRDDWFASWDNPVLDPPPLRDGLPGYDIRDNTKLDAAARAQGRLALRDVDMKDAAHPDDLARLLSPAPNAIPWSGFVLDFDDNDATRGAHPLNALEQSAQSVPIVPGKPTAFVR